MKRDQKWLVRDEFKNRNNVMAYISTHPYPNSGTDSAAAQPRPLGGFPNSTNMPLSISILLLALGVFTIISLVIEYKNRFKYSRGPDEDQFALPYFGFIGKRWLHLIFLLLISIPMVFNVQTRILLSAMSAASILAGAWLFLFWKELKYASKTREQIPRFRFYEKQNQFFMKRLALTLILWGVVSIALSLFMTLLG